MQHRPDSILEAAKKTASALRLPWSEVQKSYRELQVELPNQDAGWLPKSKGRSVWLAHPNFVSRLLAALALSGDTMSENEAVLLASGLVPTCDADGRIPAQSPFEELFQQYLTNSAKAACLLRVEFSASEKRISIVEEAKRIDLKKTDYIPFDYESWPHHHRLIADALNKPSNKRISRTVIVDGDVFRDLNDCVNWLGEGHPPVRKNLREAKRNAHGSLPAQSSQEVVK